ncbi:helix-turn-helix domain-containing protein [Streptomyces sp. NBC_00096]|uniref:helix-turn-helix domain-containing protein n=1 Tax=Streptomyces sp. NBC_00096 TaxID=2975650 RepID=UPI003251034B
MAGLRKQKGMTQEEFATAIGRTASWLSQVERGIQPVNRLDVLRLLADGLGVPFPAPAEAERTSEPDTKDLDQACMVLSGHSALDVLLNPRQDFRPDSLTLGVFAGIYRLCHPFVHLKRLAATAVSALLQHVENNEPTPQHLSVLGTRARPSGERASTRQQIEAARGVASLLGENRNDFNLRAHGQPRMTATTRRHSVNGRNLRTAPHRTAP